MKLKDLRPQFHRYQRRQVVQAEVKPPGGDLIGASRRWRQVIVPVGNVYEAQGMSFLCPACFTTNGGPTGTHRVMVTFDGCGAADAQGSHDRNGKPSRWKVSGVDFTDLTLKPSVDCGCWHGYIFSGEVR